MQHIPYHKRRPADAEVPQLRERRAAAEQFLGDVLLRHGLEDVDRSRLHTIFCLTRTPGFEPLRSEQATGISLRDTVKNRFWEFWNYSASRVSGGRQEPNARLCVAVVAALLEDLLKGAHGDEKALQRFQQVTAALNREVLGSIRFGDWRRVRKEPCHFEAAELLEAVLKSTDAAASEHLRAIKSRSSAREQKFLFES